MLEGFFSFLGAKERFKSTLNEASSKEKTAFDEDKILSKKDCDYEKKSYLNEDCPNEYSLVEEMPPVLDQGDRATCAAQAATALLEYYNENKYRLSSQFLYWATKRQDGTEALLKEFYSSKQKAPHFKAFLKANKIPRHKANTPETQELYRNSFSGSNLNILMNVIEEYGTCEYNLMPYSLAQKAKTEANSIELDNEKLLNELMQEALKNASNFKVKMKMIAGDTVDEYRNRLSGLDGFDPMPIVFSVYTFDSDNNKDLQNSGWFALPKAGETSRGGHSMLAVGYKDTPLVAGGGYLIVRNSWGTTWAWDYKNSGYARIPYAYISNYAYPSALTILSDKKKILAKQAKKIDGISRYIKIAPSDMRNRLGKFNIAKGDKIIVDSDSGKADLDTKRNRSIFKDNGYAWED